MSYERFFSDLYDSVRQRQLAGEGKTPEPGEAYCRGYRARLRLDSLLSRTIVLSDAQVLDGTFFLSHHPLSLVEFLQRDDESFAPIEVRSRKIDLRDALVGFLNDGKSDYLKKFIFSSIPDKKQRDYAAEYMETQPARRVTKWRDVPRLLREARVDPECVDHLERRWSQWFELQRAERIDVKPWRPGSFNLDSALAKEHSGTPFRGKVCAEVLDFCELVYNEKIRTNVHQYFAKFEKLKTENRLTADEFCYAASVLGFYDRAYNRAIAGQNECDQFEATNYEGPPITMQMQAVQEANAQAAHTNPVGLKEVISVSEDLLPCIALLPNSDFRNVIYQANVRKHYLEEWWKDGNSTSLFNALDLFLSKVVDPYKLPLPDFVKTNRPLLSQIGLGPINADTPFSLADWGVTVLRFRSQQEDDLITGIENLVKTRDRP